MTTENLYTCLVVQKRVREVQVRASSPADADEKATAAAEKLDYSDVSPEYHCEGVERVPK